MTDTQMRATPETSRLRYEPLRGDVLADPYPAYAGLRAQRPVYHDRRYGWIVSRYRDVAVAVRDRRLTAQRPRVDESVPCHLERIADEVRDLRGQQALWFLCSDGAYHGRLRGVVERAFTPRALAGVQRRIQQVVGNLLDSATQRGDLDVVADLAQPLAATIIADLLGVPSADRATFREWSDDIVAGGSTWTIPNLQRAHRAQVVLLAYLRQILASRADDGAPADDGDVLGLLLAAQQRREVNEDEVLATCVMLLFAGQETTARLIGNSVLALLRHPRQLTLLRERPELLASAVEELMRYDGPVQAVFRRPVEDIDIGGHTIRRDEHVLLLLGSANRDPEAFPDPDRLDLTRHPNRHVAFNLGAHYCLGAVLARLEVQVAIGTLLRRYPRLELNDDEPLEWAPNVLLRGLKRLPVHAA